MTRIRLQELTPGMLISEDAQTHLGQLVIPRGTRLSLDSIQTLKSWGIPEVDVLDQDSLPGFAEVSDPEQVTETETAVRALFSKSNTDHPAIQELIRLAVHSRLP